MALNTNWTSQAGIPVRNLWFLLVHASGLARLLGPGEGSVEGDAELPDILARLLVEAVERRLRRGLGRGYVARSAALTRVRGRIDWLATQSRQQLLRGRLTCRFQDFTLDRPRNRLARAALSALASRVRAPDLQARVRDLNRSLGMWGVKDERPSRADILADAPSARESEDKLMVEAALLALDLVLPAEEADGRALTRLSRDEQLLRQIFEAGIAGYLRFHLHGRDGWSVYAQRALRWQISAPTPGLAAILPGMFADIVLERGDRRIVVDTKFTSMLTTGQFDRKILKNSHIYQLYAYLRSQENSARPYGRSEGLLLYPAFGDEQNEAVTVDGHRLRFASVDLGRSTDDLGERIIGAVCGRAAMQLDSLEDGDSPSSISTPAEAPVN